MFLKNVFIGFLSFSILHADTLKECKNEADKISGCIERQYYKSGNIGFETPYKNGKKEGIEKWYDGNGKLGLETEYKNGKVNGVRKVKMYYKNGNLRRETPFLNDKAQGDIKYYTENGKLLATINAQNNKYISGKCHNGKVLTNKELERTNFLYHTKDTENSFNYLQKICLKESVSK